MTGEEVEEYSIQEPSGFSLSWNHLILIIPLVLIVWYFSHGKFGYTNWDNVTLWMIFGGCGIWFLYTVDSELKEKTPKIIANDFCSTTDGIGYDAGKYLVYTLGDIDYGVHFKGNKGAFIPPRKSITVVGSHIISTVRVFKVPFSSLPLEAQQVISDRRIPSPYYTGLWDAKSELNYNELQDISSEINGLRSQVSMQMDLLRGKHTAIEESVQHGKRILEAAQEKDIVSRVKKQLMEEKQSE